MVAPAVCRANVVPLALRDPPLKVRVAISLAVIVISSLFILMVPEVGKAAELVRTTVVTAASAAIVVTRVVVSGPDAVAYHCTVPKPKREIEIIQRIDICFAEVVGDKFRSMPSIQTKLNKVIKNFKEFELRRASKWKTYLPTFIEKDLRNDNFRGIIDFYSEPEATVIDPINGL